MKTAVVFIFSIVSLQLTAQHSISGTISDRRGEGVPFANIYLDGSYDGTTSDTAGNFSLKTTLMGKQHLVASSIGYETFSANITLGTGDTAIYITMKEKVSEINEVAITAGVFSASDKKKSVTLSSFDIATTASAVGDIYGAFASLPGSQKVGEQGMLFVRGGESYETKTYMDGMLVQSPYFSSMPDIPTRGRFSPLLFSETVFSTGGYSAEYGNALSSIVDLTTNGLEPEDKASFSVMTVGANASFSKRWENTSLAMTGLYANNALHHRIFRQNVDWIRDPVLADGMVMFRHRVGETGLLKSFCSANSNAMEMNYDNFPAGTVDRISLKNRNLYANTIYSGELNERWLILTGISAGHDIEDMVYTDLPVLTIKSSGSAKIVLTHLATDHLKIRMGADVTGEEYHQEIRLDSTIVLQLQDLQPSLFLEPEVKISSKLALRLGARGEYSTLMNSGALLPRFSAAFKTSRYSQVSMAWGKFTQKPLNDYLKFAPGLSNEHADHVILNFQYRNLQRTFRVEAYYKKYSGLVKYEAPYSGDPATYNNLGTGNARGVDIFWRDKKTLKGVDYWIAYSYLDTRRNYKDYPESVMPDYASRHNLSVVYKQFIAPITTFVGATYSFASGRPYDDKNNPGFMLGLTKPYHDISVNLTYVTKLFRKDCVVHMNITNLLGFQNVFGYLYSGTPGEDGNYASKAVEPTCGRQAILVFILML